MIAPEELSRKRKTVSGDTYAAITQRKPTTVDSRIAHTGTPRRLTVIRRTGASRRAARTNSIRDAVYSPELRQESTAVRTTAFMMSAAPGMPMRSNALTYGEAPSSWEFHGRITASRNTDPTKKIAMRSTTELVAFEIARSGSLDSAAAIVAISAPTIEKMTTTTPEKIASGPFGRKPPWAVRLEKSASRLGHRPST